VTGVLLALAQSDLLPTQIRRWRLYELPPHLCEWPSRLKETGYEIDFREQFIWLAPSVKIGVEFWADEAVEQYWIENVSRVSAQVLENAPRGSVGCSLGPLR
jgi:hypothetical protein